MSDNTVQFTINIGGNAFEGVSALSNKTKQLNSVVEQSESLFNKIGKACINLNQIYKTFSGTISNVVGKVMEAGTSQELELQNITTLLKGNTEAAENLYKKLSQYGKITVYDKSSLIDAQKTLMSFGIASEKAFSTIKQIGDIAMGDTQKMQSLSLAFAQATSTGKLMGQDLMQMINAGFNPLQIISERTGESMSSLKEKMSEGKISADLLSQAFAWATEEGSLFYQGAEKAGNTIAGKINQLKDNINDMLVKVFGKLQPIIDRLLQFSMNMINSASMLWHNAQNIGRTISFLSPLLLGLAGAIGAVTIAINWQNIALKAMVMWETICTNVTKVWAGVQKVLNLVMTANPIGLVIAGIVALIGVIVFLCVKIKGWGTLWDAVVTFAKETFFMFVEAVKLKYTTMINGIMIGIDKLKEAWYKLKLLLGKGDEIENNRALKEISDDIERRKKAISGGAKEVAKHAQAAANAWKGVSLSFDKSKTLKGVSKDLQASLGLGITDNTKTINNDLSTSSETISAGGKNIKNFNITIGSLIGENTNMFQSSQDSPETAGDFMEKLSMALQMIVNDVNYAAE